MTSVLDDGPSQTECICQTLSKAGHMCHSFSEGKAFVHPLLRQTFDLLVLDWSVSDMPSDEVLKWARQNLPPTLPMLFMTSRSYETNIVSMLDAGADDYIVKPVSAQILLVCVETLLRLDAYQQPVWGSREQFGDSMFDNAAAVSPSRATAAVIAHS
ncbi:MULTISPECIES: response regulator transcription factor [Burkholderiaceae]|uniref:response regulator transcription factor n=1 Tax=Burkholderiaceae TaxID=119060 RepID=UPI0009787B2B|nr:MULTISPECIES: response regulator transcription factor [Burkholderiaceae]MCG1019219.1 response regulator transcription factor [Mycetohabitans sp. B4]